MFKNLQFNIRNFLAIVVVCSITGIIILGHYKPIPPENKALIEGAVQQYIIVGFGVVIAFFFVSSKDTVDQQKHERVMKEVTAGVDTQTLTDIMKTKLRALGYTDADIDAMDYNTATTLISNNTQKGT